MIALWSELNFKKHKHYLGTEHYSRHFEICLVHQPQLLAIPLYMEQETLIHQPVKGGGVNIAIDGRACSFIIPSKFQATCQVINQFHRRVCTHKPLVEKCVYVYIRH